MERLEAVRFGFLHELGDDFWSGLIQTHYFYGCSKVR